MKTERGGKYYEKEKIRNGVLRPHYQHRLVKDYITVSMGECDIVSDNLLRSSSLKDLYKQ